MIWGGIVPIFGGNVTLTRVISLLLGWISRVCTTHSCTRDHMLDTHVYTRGLKKT